MSPSRSSFKNSNTANVSLYCVNKLIAVNNPTGPAPKITT